MALWLKCLILVLGLSLVLSAVIVVKLKDEEDIQTITEIIESKIDKQEKVLEQLKNTTETQDATIDLLNSTFQNELHYQQEQINSLTEENKGLKSEIHQTAEELQQLKKTVTAQYYSLNSTFYNGHNQQQGQINNLMIKPKS